MKVKPRGIEIPLIVLLVVLSAFVLGALGLLVFRLASNGVFEQQTVAQTEMATSKIPAEIVTQDTTTEVTEEETTTAKETEAEEEKASETEKETTTAVQTTTVSETKASETKASGNQLIPAGHELPVRVLQIHPRPPLLVQFPVLYKQPHARRRDDGDEQNRADDLHACIHFLF